MRSNMKKNMQTSEKLFDPGLVFDGDVSKMLEGYPERSKQLENRVENQIAAKNIDEKFIKDGFVYLLRGGKKGQETGFYSKEYANKNTIQSLGLDPYKTAFAQSLNGNTPFISATTDLYTALAFSRKERVYVLRVPVGDVYTFYNFHELMEHEYMIPDFVSQNEIVRSFRYDKVKSIYRYLTEEVGLDICPEDLGTTAEDIILLNDDRLKSIMYFIGEEKEPMDILLNAVQSVILDGARDQKQEKTFFKK